MEDHIKTIFLSEEERKKAISKVSDDVINAEDKESLNEYIKTQNWQ